MKNNMKAFIFHVWLSPTDFFLCLLLSHIYYSLIGRQRGQNCGRQKGGEDWEIKKEINFPDLWTSDHIVYYICTIVTFVSVPAEENTWMVIQHNNTEATRLRPSSLGNQHSVHFDYATEEEQLSVAISQSEHCEQELSYQCRRSRLLNTPGEAWLVPVQLCYRPVSG